MTQRDTDKFIVFDKSGNQWKNCLMMDMDNYDDIEKYIYDAKDGWWDELYSDIENLLKL